MQKKLIYSTDEVKLAMKIILGKRDNIPRVRRNFFSGGDLEEQKNRFIPVNDATLDWAFHVFDRMVFEPTWRINFR